jgi:drug/metabolite transporter (DMT)-like permease
MFPAFFALYCGLELGEIAKIGQLQLLQPFMTIFASSFLFAEKLSIEMFCYVESCACVGLLGAKAKSASRLGHCFFWD